MIRGEMENRVDALHRGAGHTGLPQIGLQKIHFARAEVLPNVTEMAAGQIIDDANLFRASRQQLIGKRRADERRSTSYENCLSRPKSVRRRHASTASLILLVNRQLVDDCHKFFQFLDSIIVGSSGSRCFTHGLQFLGSETRARTALTTSSGR